MGEPVRLVECSFWTRGLGGGRGVRRTFERGREAPGGAWVWFSGMGE